AARQSGVDGLRRGLLEGAEQAGRVCLLIAAAAPVGFLIAVGGIPFGALVPDGPVWLALAGAAVICVAVGMVLDTGAAILLLLPVLVPAVAAAGGEPALTAFVLCAWLLIGGLTPPVGVLVLTVKEVTGSEGVYRATLPYLAAIGAALLAISAVAIMFMG
ncbi:MAG: TRAP transporter large permease subunit, partial [Pseudomonadota bacterium]